MKKFLICLMVGLFLVTSVGIGCKKETKQAEESQEQKTPTEHPQESETQPAHH